ncbi:hypothetical protein HWV62_9855 [Athelia sp. TMB]|nr:hypothetical protein HWV62_9855 [Athelia sp. TMB]
MRAKYGPEQQPISLLTITPPSSPIARVTALPSPTKRPAKGVKPSIPLRQPKAVRIKEPNPPIHWVPHPEYVWAPEKGMVYKGPFYVVIVGQSCGIFPNWMQAVAARAGVVNNIWSEHASYEEAFEAYSLAYYKAQVFAYPLPGSKYWTTPIGRGDMRSVSQGGASASSSGFWGSYDPELNEATDPHRGRHYGVESTALERQLQAMGFDEDE